MGCLKNSITMLLEFSQNSLRALTRTLSECFQSRTHLVFPVKAKNMIIIYNAYFHGTDKKLLQTVSSHPVHILNNDKELSASSFIPFCSFGKTFIGTKIKEFELPVCDMFKPKRHYDQLCFETDLQLLKDSNYENLVNQLELGFTLVLDYNEERQLSDLFLGTSAKEELQDENYLSIYLDTISIMIFSLQK